MTTSTFEPRQEGAFSLVVGSSVAVGCKPLAPEGHGLERSVFRGEWALGSTAAGCPNHANFQNNPQFRLSVSRRTDVLLRLRLADLASSGGRKAALGLDVYRREAVLGTDEARGRTPATLTANGGVYSYPPGGVLVPRTPLEAGSVYIVVVSTFDPLPAAFELICHAESGAVRVEKLR